MPDNSGYCDLSVSAGDSDSLGEVRLGVQGEDIDEDVEEFGEEDEEVLEDNGEYDVEEEVEDVEDEEEKEEEGCKDEQTDDVLAELGSGQEEDAEAAEEEEEEDCDDLGVEDVKDKAAGMVVEDMLDGAEEREVEAQSDSKGPVETGDGDAELAAAILEDADDLSVTLKSGENDEDQNPVSSTDWVGNAEMHQHGRSKMLSTCTNGFNGASVGKTNCTVAATQAPSKENGILRALEGETFKGAQHENEISNKAPKHVKDNDIKADGSHYSGSDNSRYAQLQENVLTVEDTIKNKSKIVKHDTTEKGESDLRSLSNLLMLENVKAARVLTPQKRQRSSSPITEMVKKPAITCVYYARGWCVKGSSCKFLHQDGINRTALDDGINKTVQQAMEDKAGNNGKCDSLDIPGTKEIVEGSKASALMLNPSNAEGPLACNSPLQRALVRAYGPGISSQFHEEYSRLGTGKSQQPGLFHTEQSNVKEECMEPFSKIGNVGNMVENKLSDAMLSSRCLVEVKPVNGISSEESSYKKTFSGTHTIDASHPKYICFSGSSPETSTLVQNSNSLYAYGNTGDFAGKSMYGKLPSQDSYISHNFSVVSSGMSSPFQLSQLEYRFIQVGTSPTCGSTQRTRYVKGQTELDFDREHYGSRSISLSRDSSPYPLSHEYWEPKHYHNIPGSSPSTWQNSKTGYDAWEPSQRFCPSLAIAASRISAPGSQYDPILDSVEPAGSSCRDYCFQTGTMTSLNNSSFRPSGVDAILHGSGSAVSQTCKGMVAKSLTLQYSSAGDVANVFTGSSILEMGDHSTPKIEEVQIPDDIERLSIKDADLGVGLRSRLGKSRNNRESKEFKIFQAALVDLIKELVKPWWRDGHLSKNAHKTVLKKSVEKVLSALQPHQVPRTKETINRYLTTSKPKLLKLVEGYMQKYANS
ncbi:hypothetical protein HPP92_014193 [Vanilla planifolia]|uniref:C3H1-type domain-containing protein n=1 Tax=Vanilla planifolia TaxID=51239 RepID=A0A835UX72_VANPL|nr:hypothetical protein HPP92_014193 [Vanilla planifolia]